ncbi:MAG: CDP-alcohol phosphatidyltransferase family protein [Planctomycetes bacterium]|nr:CDP-alcohol phosphatidyltransferase family protein [Planctomycetota bacterium]
MRKLNPRRLYRRIHILPSLLTLGNFACGFLSIVLCLNALFFATRAQLMEENRRPATVTVAAETTAAFPDHRADAQDLVTIKGNRDRAGFLFFWACAVIFLGMLFDVLDGKVARHMGADSAFGTELDSLADVTSFGVAPAIIVNTISLAVMPATYAWWTQVIIFGVVFATCAVLRLARYNIQSGTADKNVFSGLPSPAAGGCIVTAVLLAEGDYAFVDTICNWLVMSGGLGETIIQVKARLLSFYLLLPGVLMVTTVPFTHVANRYLSGKKSFTILVLSVLLAAAIWHEPRLMLFLIFNGYMAWGLLAALYRALRAPTEKEGEGGTETKTG